MPKGSFTCPACGAEFDVQERLDEADERAAEQDKQPAVASRPASVDLACPACGADFDVTETLDAEAMQ